MVKDPKKTNRSEQAYTALKQAIIDGNFKPGEKLKEVSIAEMLNTSRTPVRDALRKLEQEGLVSFFPSLGAEVTKLSREKIIHLYECRSVLEGLAARKAVSNMNTEQLHLTWESIILAESYQSKGEMAKVVEKNTIFHDTILRSSQNHSLIQMMNNIRTHILRYRKLTSTMGFRPTFLKEHRAIFQAISAGNADEAELLMKNHVLDDLKTILKGLEIN